MEPTGHFVSEAAAYTLLDDALTHLQAAERVLGHLQAAQPTPERALHLGALRSAIAELRTVGRRTDRLIRPAARAVGTPPSR